MLKFRNENVQKEAKKKNRNLIISILIIIVAVVLFVYASSNDVEEEENKKYLNDVIMEQENTDKKSYVNVAVIPYAFAEESETSNKYYLITDGKYLYIVYLTDEQFNELDRDDIETTPIRIDGITKAISDNILEYALETYNEPLDEENKISADEAKSYFGTVYLDATTEFTEANDTYFAFGALVGIIGIIYFVIALILKIKYNRSINKLSEEDINLLDDEMNSASAFYYDRQHLCLTENYIIQFSGKFKAISYKDVVWMYKFVQRVNFVKSYEAINIMTNDGKLSTIATFQMITKSRKELFEEIWNTIANKNPKILLGYSNENKQKMKEEYGRKKNKKELL